MIDNSTKISLIACIGKNRELGKGNKLIFDIPEDMKFFREKTRGHTVIMGRKTYESIGHPLPNRTNIVVTHNPELVKSTDVKTADSIEQALEVAKATENDEVFVIGGEQTYRISLPFADKLYLTLVDAQDSEADAYFPDYSEFKTTLSERKSRDENYVYNFLELAR